VSRSLLTEDCIENLSDNNYYYRSIMVVLGILIAILFPRFSWNATWTLCVPSLLLARQGAQSVPDAIPRKSLDPKRLRRQE